MNEKKELLLKIEDTTNLGHGVAKDGGVIFVRNTVCEDTVKAEVIKKCSGYRVARMTELVTPSPYRIENDCPVFTRCGGCSFRHVSYEYEKELKRSFVASCFRKEGFPEINIHPVVSASEDGYRSKTQYPVAMDKDGRLFLGFYSEYSHRAVNADCCKTEKPVFAAVKREVTEIINSLKLTPYDEQSGKGLLRHVCMRCVSDGSVSVCFVVNSKAFNEADAIASRLIKHCPEVKSVSYNINTDNTDVIMGEKTVMIAGSETVTETLCGKHFSIAPGSFFQVNRDAAELLYNKGKELLAGKSGVLLDLYCGVGSIGICLAGESDSLYGVEISPDAVINARQNAGANGFRKGRAVFLCGDAADGIEGCRNTFGEPDCVIIDPPRKGISPETLSGIASSGVNCVLYISCNPATMARDMASFRDHGYVSDDVYPFDLFPRTGHVENITLLSKK